MSLRKPQLAPIKSKLLSFLSEQVDFVPTFSLLMGLPIPFSNLGAVIPDAFMLSDEAFSATRQLQYIGINLDQGLSF